MEEEKLPGRGIDRNSCAGLAKKLNMRRINREEFLRIKGKLIDKLAGLKPEISYLFGSFARDDQSPESDVDILVDVDPSIGLDFVILADEIEEILGMHVDLVTTRAINARHMEYIERDALYV